MNQTNYSAGNLISPATESPLSAAQRRLWFMDQLAPDIPLYNVPLLFAIEGQLDADLLSSCLDALVVNHTILRTYYRQRGQQPVQIVADPSPVPFVQVDMRGDAVDPAALLLAHAQRPFSLHQTPLIRALLVRLSETEYRLLLTCHHITVDNWSIATMVQELAQLYAAGCPAPGTFSNPPQYLAYALQENRDADAGDISDPDLAYWLEQFNSLPPVLNLPTDHLRPASPSYRGARLSQKISAETTQSLRRLGGVEGVSLFAATVATFQLLLYRYTGETDIAVGTVLANRKQDKFDEAVGFFVNTLPLRTNLAAADTFRALLQQVNELSVNAYEHQGLPLETLIGHLAPTRRAGQNPLFQVVYAWQSPTIPDVTLGDAAMHFLEEMDTGTAKFDLSLSVEPRQDGLQVTAEYSSDLFTAETINRLLSHFQQLLTAVTANPDQPLSAYSLLTPEERTLLVHTWNATQATFPHEETAHERVAAQVVQSPQAVAVYYRERETAVWQPLTYQQLDAKANQLAHFLQSQGVGRGALVGIATERTPAMIIAVLGVLKAGAAYLPLDPTYPPERLAYMIADADIPLLLTETTLQEQLSFVKEKRVVYLDTAWAQIDVFPEYAPAGDVCPDDLAYVIYTSGSTGQPKGTMLHHRGLVNLMAWQKRTFALQNGDRILQFSAFSFDASVWEIFAALGGGAALCLAPTELLQSPPELVALLEEMAINIVTLPPTLLAAMPSAELPHLRTILTAGEACTADLVQRWSPGRTFYNAYGPTETTICASIYRCESTNENPPIGRPLDNLQLYVLDERRRPVPIGVAGELCVGGVGVAHGYLNRPHLTAERFIPNHFSDDPNARLYCTGDLVRYRSDGNLVFLGRIDHQVKIRGFRIELGEIEFQLSRHPQLDHAVVLAREDKPGDRRLVAYVTGSADTPPDSAALHQYLSDRLPDYMIPAVFVNLATIPLLPNGKVARTLLPKPDAIRPFLDKDYAPPQTDTEAAIAAIWKEMLGIAQVGIHDDFFVLGGHSLLAAQVVARIRDVLQVALPLRAFFDGPTVAGLATAVSAAETVYTPHEPANRHHDRQIAPLSFAQERLWFLHRLHPQTPIYQLSIGLALRGPLQVDALQKSLDTIVTRHDVLRTTFFQQDGRPMQRVSPESHLPLLIKDFSSLPHDQRQAEAAQYAVTEANRPFDLQTGPLVRAYLIRLAEDEHHFWFTQHHIISDGWSLTLFIRELTTCYTAYATGNSIELFPLPLQFADYVARQQNTAAAAMASQLTYWREQLANAPELLQLPTDFPRPATQTYNGDIVTCRIPAETAVYLQTMAQETGGTLFMALLGAFSVLMARYSNQRDLVIGTPVSGREQPELDALMGFFVNTVALRLQLPQGVGFRTWLNDVRQVALAAFAHQDVPYGKVVQAVSPSRNTAFHPLFQVMFTFEHEPVPPPNLPDLTADFLPDPTRTAIFDLTCTALAEIDGSVSIKFEYNTNLFREETITRMGRHFQTLLSGIVAAPDEDLFALPILPTEERHQLLHEWNDTAVSYPTNQTADALVAAQAAAMPHETALLHMAGNASEWSSMTYRELDGRANQLAHFLQTYGVQPDDLIGIAVNRTPEMTIAILGVLKAGAAYLPLDPTYPADRLSYMMQDAEIKLLLTEAELLPHLPVNRELQTVCLDTDWSLVAGYPVTAPVNPAGPDNLAYVIYTSGSTGRPKGTLLHHRGLVNLISWQQRYFRLGPGERVLQFSAFSFDVSVWDIFMALCSGATLCLASAATIHSPLDLVALMDDAQINITTMPPTMLAALPHAELPALHTLIVAGEACPADLVQRWAVGRNFYNGYGPTEATIITTFEKCDPHEHVLPPIGRPLTNVQLYILDRQKQPVPIGVPGELYIGGVGVAKGYLNRPNLTAERFVPDPFSSNPKGKLYRTGDLVRYRPDGRVDFLGRIDHQVKIRGFRIELGEIESLLSQHPRLTNAVVLADEKSPGDWHLIAYVVSSASPTPTVLELRRYLAQYLPDYMIPAVFIPLTELPQLPNGKVNRAALPQPTQENRLAQKNGHHPPVQAIPAALTSTGPLVATQNSLERLLADLWQEMLTVPQVGLTDNFFDLGGHSLLLARIHMRLQAQFPDLALIDLYHYPTIKALADYLRGSDTAVTVDKPSNPVRTDDPIAVIGLAGRFPGAANVNALWANICNGVEGLTTFSDDELRAAGVDPSLLNDPAYVKAAGILADIDKFDAAFFGYTPREAALMDPQQRLFLECAWTALEHSGYGPERINKPVGVFAGSGQSNYRLHNLQTQPDLINTVDELSLVISNGKDFLPTRVSYKLNLTGPSISVQTACSTSLVAIHLACQSLRQGECDVALAGGVTVQIPHQTGYRYVPDGIASPDGHCRAFDTAAQGTVGSSGVGVVALKRLSDAQADGDTIYAVVKGSAMNNDGDRKVGYTAPSIDGQTAVLRAAYAAAGVTPDTVQYVETHGTGTALGDPIEVAALTELFREHTSERNFCMLGALKTNVGHMDAASGVGGFIKAVMALHHKTLPPNLHFENPLPALKLDESPFYVATTAAPWKQRQHEPCRAAVSSFGIGGTNAHVILEEAPLPAPAGPTRPFQVLTLSAATEEALDDIRRDMAAYLAQPDAAPLADVAYTLNSGRKPFGYRYAVLCADEPEAAAALGKDAPATHVEQQNRPVCFLFPGQGAQYVNMGRELYRHEPVFREHVDACAAYLQPHLNLDLAEILYPASDNEAAASSRLQQTYLTQPAIFTISYALAQLWQAWGVKPAAMIGHSIGEYVAACLAGVFSLEDALALVVKRGQLMQAQPTGSMLSIAHPAADILPYLDAGISLAADNAPDLCVVSGPTQAIKLLANRLQAEAISCRPLHTSHAFHSAMMEPIMQPFAEAVGQVKLHPPQIPIVSNVTGDWLTEAQAVDPAYWAQQARLPVQFRAGLAAPAEIENPLLLEVGPGRTLSSLVRRNGSHFALSSLPHPRDQQNDEAVLLRSLGQLWQAGVSIDWPAFFAAERRRRVPLPTYPFARERHWVEPGQQGQVIPGASLHRQPSDEWFSLPGWQPAPPCGPIGAEPATWVLLDQSDNLSDRLAQSLEKAGHQVIRIYPGGSFADEQFFAVLPERPFHIIALQGQNTHKNDPTQPFYDLLAFLQGLGRRTATFPLTIQIVTHHAQAVIGNDLTHPEQTMLWGMAKVANQEYPHLMLRTIDFDNHTSPDRLAAELIAGQTETAVAYRHNRRWTPTFTALPRSLQGEPRLRKQGVYWITGGLGELGLHLAHYLAHNYQARLILTGRSDATRRQSDLATLRAAGAEVIVYPADVADQSAMSQVYKQLLERFGVLHGVFHLAGVVHDDYMVRLSESTNATCTPHFQAKVTGTDVLVATLTGQPLDFVVLFSSLAALLGGNAFGAYAAANAYMDALAHQRQADNWISINWDGWDVDTAAAGDAPALTDAEGWEALSYVLSLDGVPQTAVSTTAISARYARWVIEAAQPVRPQATSEEKPGKAIHFANEVERKIAAFWRELLGIPQIKPTDNFFDLGGHSLLGTQLVARMREQFGIPIKLQLVFDSPTISKQAEAIRLQQLQQAVINDDTETILDLLEGLSDEEAAALLTSLS